MEKIKILHIEPASDMGGVSHFILHITQFLSKNDFEIHFVAPAGGVVFGKLEKQGVITHELQVPLTVRSLLRARRELREYITKNKISIVHAHTARAGVMVAVSLKGLLTSFVYTGHGWRFLQKRNFFSRVIYQLLETKIVQRADILTCLSQKEYAEAVKYFKVSKESTSIIPYSLRIPETANDEVREKFRKANTGNTSAYVITMVGRITHQKDPETFFRIVQCLVKEIPHVHFIWVGDGPLREQYTETIRKNNLHNQFTFTGSVEPERVGQILQASNAMLFTSRFEGLPISILEAMAYALPIVATNVGSISDAILHSETGYLFEQGDVASAVAHIKDLYMNPALARQISLNAQKFVRTYYSPETKTSQEFASLYQKLYENSL